MLAALDDGLFKRGWSKTVIVLVLHDEHLEPVSILAGYASVDGDDATDVAVELARRVEASAVLVDSVTCCGFNVVDGSRLFTETGTPVIHVYLYPLDLTAIERALVKANQPRWKLDVIRSHWLSAKRLECSRGALWVTAWGLDERSVARLVCSLQRFSRVPLPLHNAHRIAQAMSSLLLARAGAEPRGPGRDRREDSEEL